MPVGTAHAYVRNAAPLSRKRDEDAPLVGGVATTVDEANVLETFDQWAEVPVKMRTKIADGNGAIGPLQHEHRDVLRIRESPLAEQRAAGAHHGSARVRWRSESGSPDLQHLRHAKILAFQQSPKSCRRRSRSFNPVAARSSRKA